MKREILLALVVVGAGCALQNETPKPSLRALGQSVTTEEERSDEAIGLDIRNRLNSIGAGETSSVIVEVNDGTVTLTGTATTLAAAWRTEAAAHSVKGVKQVFNKIIVPNTSQ